MGILRLCPFPSAKSKSKARRYFRPIGIGWPVHLISILILSTPFVSSVSGNIQTHDPHPLCLDPKNALTCQLQEQMKLKIARLESTLEESNGNLNAKGLYLVEMEKQIEEMTNKIHFLRNALVGDKKLQVASPNSEERINGLEEEVRNLWDASRKTNFDIHILESEMHDAQEKIEELTSRVEQMENIVNEQWIQIRQLEQGLQMTEMRTLKAQGAADSSRYIFLKFIKGFSADNFQKLSAVLDPDLYGKDFVLTPYLSEASYQFKRLGSVAQKYHHELQSSVKQLMDMNEFTAALANEEVVFFLASAVITFPVMIAWLLFTSCFSGESIHLMEENK